MCCLLQETQKKIFYNISLSVGLTTLGTLVNFDWLIHLVECSNVSTTYFNLQKENFVYNHLECTSIYRPLSYPFKSLYY